MSASPTPTSPMPASPTPASTSACVPASPAATPDAEPALLELLDRNPGNAGLYLKLLVYCAEPRTPQEVAAFVEGARTGSCQIQSAASLVDALERKGGLARTVLVDGARYPGTLRDLQADDAVSPDAAIEQTLRTTDVGARVAAQRAPERRLEALLARYPEHEAGLRAVLAMCEGEGRTTGQIQEDLRALGALPCDERTGVELVHASFFTGVLERAGALEWKDKLWRTAPDAPTADGRQPPPQGTKQQEETREEREGLHGAYHDDEA